MKAAGADVLHIPCSFASSDIVTPAIVVVAVSVAFAFAHLQMNQCVANGLLYRLKQHQPRHASFDVCLPNPAVDVSKMIAARICKP